MLQQSANKNIGGKNFVHEDDKAGIFADKQHKPGHADTSKD